MPALTYERILAHRAVTFRLQPGQQLRSRSEAVQYVDERGFVYF